MALEVHHGCIGGSLEIRTNRDNTPVALQQHGRIQNPTRTQVNAGIDQQMRTGSLIPDPVVGQMGLGMGQPEGARYQPKQENPEYRALQKGQKVCSKHAPK